jgi:hypothetical protein
MGEHVHAHAFKAIGGLRSHSSLMILVRSLFVASGKSPCTPSFIALVKNINAVVGFRTFGRGAFLIAA